MRSTLRGMMQRLEKELDKVDLRLNRKLEKIDKDADGVVTAEELADAVQHGLREHNTAEEAAAIVARLDENRDGKVTLEELRNFIDAQRETMEELGALPPRESSEEEEGKKDKEKKKDENTNAG